MTDPVGVPYRFEDSSRPVRVEEDLPDRIRSPVEKLLHFLCYLTNRLRLGVDYPRVARKPPLSPVQVKGVRPYRVDDDVRA